MEWMRQVTLVLCLLGATTAAAWTPAREMAPAQAQALMNSHVKSLQENRQKVRLLKNLLEDLDMNMEAVHYKALERAKSCTTNMGNDDCVNPSVPGAGDDGGYFGSDSTPGKRATLDTLSSTAFRKAWLRCLNTGGDDCANSGVPGAGGDSGYFGGDSTPGKRATLDTLSSTAFRKAWLRCLNTGGDDCANSGVPGAGGDSGYFGGDSTPGKRSLPQFNAKYFCLYFPMSPACRNV